MKFSLENLNKNAIKIQDGARKYAPLISMVAGTALVLYGAKKTYDASKEIALITSELERRKAEGEEITRREVFTRVGRHLVLPGLCIVGGLGAFFNAYHVLTNRLTVVSGMLATSLKDNERLKQAIKSKYPNATFAPTTGESKQVLASAEEANKKKPKMVEAVKPLEICNMEQVCYRLSLEYAADNLDINLMQIESANRILTNKLMADGRIFLSDVYSVLRIPSEVANYNQARRLKWTDSDYFELSVALVNVSKEEDGLEVADKVPFVSWPAPRPVDGGEELLNDYSEYAY